MHNYTVSITRESDRQWISFPFAFEVTIRRPAAVIWDEWRRTLVDYRQGFLWADKYSQPSTDTVPPREGARLTLTYQIPNPDKPGSIKNATYQFDITGWSDEKHFFEYRATETHPFLRGGGQVTVEVLDADSCHLRWAGTYRHAAGDPHSIRQGDVFAHFLGMFFTALAQKIRKNVPYEDDAAA